MKTPRTICMLCDEPLSGKQTKFCSELCCKIYHRNLHRWKGDVRTCACGCGREFFTRYRQRIYYERACYRTPTNIGTITTCRICGESFNKTATNSVYHKDCESDGRKIQCTDCKEMKDYESFYDYRKTGGKFVPTCKPCCVLRVQRSTAKKTGESHEETCPAVQ